LFLVRQLASINDQTYLGSSGHSLVSQAQQMLEFNYQ